MDHSDGPLAVALTVAFVACGAYHLLRLVGGPGSRDRVGSGAHVLMCAAMAAMPWAWYLDVPVAPQIAVFGAATVWYLALAARNEPPAGLTHHHRGRLALGYHAVMMLAMVWMAIAMSGGAMGGGAMSGSDMSMPGMAMRGSTSRGLTLSWISGVVFAVAAVAYAVTVVREARRGRPLQSLAVADDSVGVLMAAGMSVAFLALMV